jgi:DNA invertase Pin-like site-specific DNA recombinase
MARTAFSYNRYSSPQQSDGDSIRRQTALARAWCARNGANLDTEATYEDRGTSGFRGKHRECGMLRRFLDDVELGRIPRGSVLLIENMDRLSREKPAVGVNVLTGILLAGVRIVQLAPDEIELTEDSDLFTLFRGQMAQARGHDESKTKAARMSAVWGERQRLAREEGERVTTRMPGWLEVRGSTIGKMRNGRAKVLGGTVHVVPARAKIIRGIFRLAIEGNGLALIVRHLTETGAEPWGRGEAWNKAYVHKILTGRAVLGEYQPMKDDKPNGDPIPGYFPAVIDEDTWDRARAALTKRKEKPGRIGEKVVALFSGLLVDAATGERVLVVNQTRGSGTANRQKRRVLVPAGSMEGRERAVSFPLDVFESSVLGCLNEIDPADVLGGKPEGESVTLAAELARVKHSMVTIHADLEANGDSPALFARLRKKEAEHATLTRQFAAARLNEKHPKAAALSEAVTLIATAEDTAGRLRLRQLLRDVIDEVWVLIVPGDGARFAAVQIRFAGGRHRDYIIGYRAARRGVAGEVFVPLSFASAGLPDEIDLRDRADAAKVERLLARL